jgi:hypothetical protein
LTERELEVLLVLMRGESNQAIAEDRAPSLLGGDAAANRRRIQR